MPWSIDQVRQDPARRHLAAELLTQLADDDLIIGFRDQEWLGLAPHIEEDVAFGSIGQEEIGHAAHFYHLLEELGLGSADDLASLRPARERRNSVLLEQPNGPGHYLEDPHFDWAWTIVRHYAHDVWEMTVLAGLEASALTPLADAARKILPEKRYHRAHQELWLKTMARHDDESRARLIRALLDLKEWWGDLAGFGEIAPELGPSHLLPSAAQLPDRFHREVRTFFAALEVDVPAAGEPRLNGRAGQHTEALAAALATLSEVYRLDPKASW